MSDAYVQDFVDCVNGLGLSTTVTPEAVASVTRRTDLGISSLEVILVVDAYLRSRPESGLTVQADWVPRLDEVAGILSVFEEIDRAATGAVPAP
jgi:hypothetical protein